MLEKDIKKVLFSQEDIVAKTKELGQQLTEDYAGKNPLLVCVLKGAVPFMAELIKHIDTHIEMDFMVVSSYGGGTVSSGEVKILKDVDTNVEGRDIIFIEDIIDPAETRVKVIANLEMLEGKRVSRLPKKHSNIQI